MTTDVCLEPPFWGSWSARRSAWPYVRPKRRWLFTNRRRRHDLLTHRLFKQYNITLWATIVVIICVDNLQAMRVFFHFIIYRQRLRWSKGSVLAFSTQVRGFKPGRSHRIFRAKKILSTPSFGGEVKPSVACRRFAACKRSLNLRGSRNLGKITGQFLAHSSTFRC